ncbi:MAG: PilZ domain-containing protein [Deltaproteobacteria bacterium]|nr:PilZ domain-containing protein [Deltaproteobacteria bacterium]
MDEKRSQGRESLTIEARYQDIKGNVLRGTVRNISLGGAYIETLSPLVKGCPLQLGLDVKDIGKIFDVHGHVLRTDLEKGMAVGFTGKSNEALRDLIDMIKRLGPSSTHVGIIEEDVDRSRLKNPENMSNNSIYQDGRVNRKDKRQHSRKLLRIEARYQNDRGKVLKGTVRDISLGGVYIDTHYPLEPQSELTLSLDAVDIGKVIDVQGYVVRAVPHRGMAIEFSNKSNRDIKLLLSAMRKLDQASLLSLSRSGMGGE